MSSGKIESIYLKNVENNFIFDKSAIATEFDLQKSMHIEPKSNKEDLEKELINNLKHTFINVIDNYFKMIKEIHFILKNSQDLTLKQKFAYCNRQRFYMKLYLEKISKGV
ncbi:MAG: hypothetical protein JSV23_00340 [Promethearchaeota archaeon]|nr:MAG: hypothetical protein JSV23_00340 [Candidatus Lokiarchaeota archaeon]